MYSEIMLSIEHDREVNYIPVRYKTPTKHWYICKNKDCSQKWKEYSKITLENSKVLKEIKVLLELKIEGKKEENPFE